MAMTAQQVAEWLRAHGVSDSVIADEAAYLADKYADPDEDILTVLANSLPQYLQRGRSGTDYSTSAPDPSVSVGGVTAPARSVYDTSPPNVIGMITPSSRPPLLTNAPDSMFRSSFTNVGGAFTSASVLGGSNPMIMLAVVGVAMYFTMRKGGFK